MLTDDDSPVPSKIAKLALEGNPETELIQLSDGIFMSPNKTIGNHNNIREGEVRSSVYGVRPCVIKFAELSQQNLNEAEILTKLGSHTNVIAIIQSGTYCDVFEERVYIALDKCHHENLRQYLANRKADGIEFDLNQAIDFAKQIIVGVTYIHDNNVIHLDLKPSNILISQNLTLIKIADFGLSIMVKSSKSKVFHKRQFGTNGYRPIESFGNGEVSQRTDIFSLGTVLLHLLSNGNNVFGQDEHEIIHNVMNDVTDISGLLVGNPITTEHLIKCMVSKERCRRPNIWEVSDHPCWSGMEVECNFDYFADDEIDDANFVKVIEKEPMTSLKDIEREREFVQRMREMGFNRKPVVVVFDKESRHLHRFDHRSKSLIKMHKFPDSFASLPHTITAVGEYIYVVNGDRSFYRIEYGDVTAEWERMADWIGEHGRRPLSVTSADAIFLVGTRRQFRTKATKSVSRYDPQLGRWESLENKPTAISGAGLLCDNKFLYCIGGVDEKGQLTNIVERMDLTTREWTVIASLNHKRHVESAVKYKGKIYAIALEETKIQMEVYDPVLDQWAERKPANHDDSAWVYRAFAIDDDLLLAESSRIIKYDVEKNELDIIISDLRPMIEDATIVRMSQ